MIYLDYNATTPLHPDIKPRIKGWLDVFGNPSSLHYRGRVAAQLLEEARYNALKWLDCCTYRLIFTSGGTEANHLALQFLYRPLYQSQNSDKIFSKRKRVLFSAIEHSSILCHTISLRSLGYEVMLIPVSPDGLVDLNFIENWADEACALVSVMLASNETGALQPIDQIARICRSKGVFFHCDAIQAPGKIKLNLKSIDPDSLSLSAHKVYALKGCGALLFRKKPAAIFCGGPQEQGLRAGTENLLGILAFAEALKLIHIEEQELLERLESLRTYMEERLCAEIPCRLVSKNAPRLSNTLCLSIDGMENDYSVLRLSQAGFAISRGSACHSGLWEPSHVLLAMGLSAEEAGRSVRVSLGRDTTKEHVEQFVETLRATLHEHCIV